MCNKVGYLALGVLPDGTREILKNQFCNIQAVCRSIPFWPSGHRLLKR